jgi:alpha-1,6-mannosyltransferase
VKRKQLFFLLLAAGQGLCYLLLLALGNLRENIVWAEIWFFIAFLLYWTSLALINIRNLAGEASTAQPDAPGQPSDFVYPTRYYIAVIIFFACCFRFILWLSTPTLSNDIYRYVWEGKIFAAGLNPFTHAPSDQVLHAFRDEVIYPNINHKELATIYPPMSLFIFKLCAQVSATIAAMKMTFILFDLLTIGTLLLILRALYISPVYIIIYAWNPLVIMEFAGSGHLDSAGIFFLMLALYFFIARRQVLSTITLTISFLAKFLPGMFIPFLLGKRKVLQLVIFGLLVGLWYVPFFSAEEKIFNSLIQYSQRWVFNASLYDVFRLAFHSNNMARLFTGAVLLCIFLGLYFRYMQGSAEDRQKSIISMVFILLGCTFMLTPVFYPWYLCWIIPLLVIIPNRAWLILSGTIFLSYLVWKGYTEAGIWEEKIWVKTVEYALFYGLLLYDGLRGIRKRKIAA